MDAEKDRWGDKLHDVEKAREDKYFAERDREMLEKLRRDPGLAGGLTCPGCGAKLEVLEEGPLRVYACQAGHGWWLTPDDLRALGELANKLLLDRLLARVGKP